MTHVALLRGINVGGKNIVPMKALAQIFADAGCTDVRTYIQSGNVVFEPPKKSAKLADATAAAIEKQFGFAVPVVIRSSDELRAVIRDNPYLKKAANDKALHVYFLATAPTATAIATLDPNRSAPDAFHVAGHHIYLHLPNGMGRTKLTNAYFDSKLATICTARNWATILKLAEMAEA